MKVMSEARAGHGLSFLSPWFLVLLALCLALSGGRNANAQSVVDEFRVDINAAVNVVVAQPDGKLIVGGQFTTWNGQALGSLGRLIPDGSRDAAFAPDIVGEVYSVALQPDGKVLAAGAFTQVAGVAQAGLARLDADGSLDASFMPVVNGPVHVVAAQADGGVLVGGDFSQVNGVARANLARLHPDGTLDPAFMPDANGRVLAMLVLADGRIVVGGEFTQIGGEPRSRVARLHPNGSADATFAADADQPVLAMALQIDGGLVLAGEFTELGGVPRARLARLHADGSVDAAFSTGANQTVRTVSELADGKLILGGDFTQLAGQARNRMARLNHDGSLDGSFSLSVNAAVHATTVQADGKVVVGGLFTQSGGQSRPHLLRITVSGGVEQTFQAGASGQVSSLAVLPGGRMIVGGLFGQVAGQARRGIARLNSEGGLDTTFNTSVDGWVNALAVQRNGQILVGGLFSSVGGFQRRDLARLNADGSVDTGFVADTNNAEVLGLTLQPDGKVIVVGVFASINNEARRGIARLNPDASLDPAFGIWNTLGSIHATAVLPDGAILIGGSFHQINNSQFQGLARIKPDGSFDYNYKPQLNGGAYAFATQPDGKVLVGGMFSRAFGQSRRALLRLNPDGSLDNSFTSTLDSGMVRAIAVQPDGKVLVGGSFAEVGGQARTNLVRLNPDGSLDSSFVADTNEMVWDIALQTDGKVLLGGEFTTVQGVSRSRIARLSIPDAAVQRIDETFDRWHLRWMRAGAGPEMERVWFERSDDGAQYSFLADAIRIDGGWSAPLPARLPKEQSLWLRARGSVAGSMHQSVRMYHHPLLHKVTVRSQGGGTAGPAQQTVNDGAPVTFTAIPDAWHNVSVTGDTCTPVDNGDGSWSVPAVTDDCVISVQFSPFQYTVSVSTKGNGTASPVSQQVDHGSQAVFSLPPATGHYVASATGDTCTVSAIGNDQWQTSDITEDCAIAVTFLRRQYTVTAQFTGNGSVSPLVQTIAHGDPAVFTLLPDPNHRVLSAVGDTCALVDNGDGTWVTGGIAADCAISISFDIKRYTLSATVTGPGTVSPTVQTVPHGGSASLSTMTTPGHQLVAFSGDTCTPVSTGTSTWAVSNVIDDCGLVAVFDVARYTVTGLAVGQGVVDPGSQTVLRGGEATLTVAAAQGHHLVSVIGDTCTPVDHGGGTWKAASITAACTITATFALSTYPVTVDIIGEGAVTPTSQTVPHGGAATLAATPAAGHYLATLHGDTCTVRAGSSGSWSTGALTAACHLTATFNPARVGGCFVRSGALGIGDGTSWQDAYPSLASALADPACHTIHIAADQYLPVEPADPAAVTPAERDATFLVGRSAHLLGGYPPVGGTAGERDPGVFPTILSGDLGGDDLGEGGITGHYSLARGDNSFHVVTVDAPGGQVALDGLVISAGQAGGSSGGRDLGAGILQRAGSVSVLRSRLLGHHAYRGGAVYVAAGDLSLVDSEVAGNYAVEHGGAVYAGAGEAPPTQVVMDQVTVSGNAAGMQGGALYAGDGSLSDLHYVTITGNDAPAGAGFQQVGGHAMLMASVVAQNTGGDCSRVSGELVVEFTLVGDGSCEVQAGTYGNLVGEARLQALGANGGPTRTHLPRPDSPLLDAVPCAPAPGFTDQRGVSRPQGDACDMGAVEREVLVADLIFANGFE
ncbi:delta-60 repeat domain-containing protein [Xanthomonadaceae bacterium JHOS43]|nr:delta-60 repeat domain-containing protein [Xanthomonadaceae bacterium JHOS43]